jgi:quercetin dioxygenase-like cupin family protein
MRNLNVKPYIADINTATILEVDQLGCVFNRCYIDEPEQVSFGVKDYAPGRFVSPHHHRTWELIIIDSSSEGPAYTFFDGYWWRVHPGSAVFIPKGYPNGWSAGRDKGFKMLWVYGGSLEEADRIIDIDTQDFHAITPAEEKNALTWPKR